METAADALLRPAGRMRYNRARIEVNAMPTATVAKKRLTVKGATRTAASRRTRRPLDDPKKRREAIRLATRLAILLHGDALRDLAHR